MRKYVLELLAIGLLLTSGFFLGCSGGSGSGMGSGWIGLTNDNIRLASSSVKILPVNTKLAPSEITAVAVQVADSNGKPVEGSSVTLSSLLGGTFDPSSGETKAGWFYSKFTAGANAGTESITALAAGEAATASLLIVARENATPAVSIFLGAASITPKSTTSIAVFATQNGIPANDLQVVFSSSKGGEFKEPIGTVSKGWFNTTFTAPETAGPSLISARVLGGEASSTLTITLASAPVRLITVSATPDAIYTKQTTTVIVQVRDENGIPANAQVFMASSLDGKFTPEQGESKDGVFYTTFESASEIGSCTISALYFGVTATTTISILKPPIRVALTSAQERIKRNSTKNPLTIYVSNELNNPVGNTDVLLTSTLGLTFESEAGKTNDGGFFSTYFIASSTLGSATITAMAQDAVGSLTLTIW